VRLQRSVLRGRLLEIALLSVQHKQPPTRLLKHDNSYAPSVFYELDHAKTNANYAQLFSMPLGNTATAVGRSRLYA